MAQRSSKKRLEEEVKAGKRVSSDPSSSKNSGLEEAKDGKRVSSEKKRVSSDPSSSKNSGLEEAKDGKRVSSEKKLYAFVSHEYCAQYVYSLFALGIPSPGAIVKTVPITVPKAVPSVCNDPERTLVVPILRFHRKNNWPVGMRCIRLGSKLYFLGGKNNDKNIFPTEVYVLDLSEEIPPSKRDHADKVVKQVASMKTGKSPPFVYFVADGKIFVVSGVSRPVQGGGPLTQFEIFNPSEGEEGEGKWEQPSNQPTFDNCLCLFPPLVIRRKLFFHSLIFADKKFTEPDWCYDIDAGIWSYYCNMDRFDLQKMLDGEVVGEAIWKVGYLEYMLDDEVVGQDSSDDEEAIWEVGMKPAAFRLDISQRNKKKKNKPMLISGEIVKYDMYSISFDTPWQDVRCALRSLGSDSPPSSGLCFCYLKFESQNGLICNILSRRVNVVLFEILPDGNQGSHSAKYITSAHYLADFDVGDAEDYMSYLLVDAHLV